MASTGFGCRAFLVNSDTVLRHTDYTFSGSGKQSPVCSSKYSVSNSSLPDKELHVPLQRVLVEMSINEELFYVTESSVRPERPKTFSFEFDYGHQVFLGSF